MAEKLTPEEIKKALECCKMPVGSGSCNDCPFDYQREKRLTSTDKSCTTLMFDYALDLINRQQAEIERLNVELVGMRGACNSYKMHYDNAKAEIERLRENNKAIMQTIADVHTEAIKEFAERLEEAICKIPQHHFTLAGVIWLIKKFVKEMVGEDKC